jgi:AmiR/NasT family two-component response regulator
VIADVMASWVFNALSRTPVDSVTGALDADADFHAIVHNAAGMVSVQLGVSVAEALVRLRAYAFSHEQPLTSVAEDVVTRRLRFQ